MNCTTCGKSASWHRLATVRGACQSPGGMGTYGEEPVPEDIQLRVELVELRMRVKELENGLRPFAEAGDNYGSIWHDDLPIERSYSDHTLPGLVGRKRHLNIGDLRRARTLIPRES